MALLLICALPNPGCAGAPRGLFYHDTPEGRASAAVFAEQESRPGWGVFECPNPMREDVEEGELFASVLAANGWGRQ
jgi:hypothetical protein